MRRVVLIGLVAGVAVGAVIVTTRRRSALVTEVGTAEWPPLRLTTPLVDVEVPPAAADAAELATWVPSSAGQCPSTHPVKGNRNSGIYHLPGGRFYDATVAERCYRDPAAAEADGMRASKR